MLLLRCISNDNVVCNTCDIVMSLHTLSSLRWKMSCDTLTPKGRCLTLYLPKRVLKVKRRLDSSSSSMCQYPLLVSATEKYFFPSIWGSILSMVSNAGDECFCLSLLGSKHRRAFCFPSLALITLHT